MISHFSRRVLNRCFSSPSSSGGGGGPSSATPNSSSSGGRGPFSVYNRWLGAAPIMTKCTTSGLLSLMADVVCQIQFPAKPVASSSGSTSTAAAPPPPIDVARVLKFAALGAFFTGPTLHYWYGFLAQRFPGATLGNAVQRLALDQLVFAPCFVPSFFAAVMVLDGKPHMIREKLTAEWYPTMVSIRVRCAAMQSRLYFISSPTVLLQVTNYSVWVPAMFVNFLLVPPSYQVGDEALSIPGPCEVPYVATKPSLLVGALIERRTKPYRA